MQTLRKVRWTLTPEDALLLYKSSLLPYFDQGDLFYSCAKTGTLQTLQTMQNKALRVIYPKKNWEGTHATHVKSKLLYTEQRRKVSLLKHAHSLSYDQSNLKGAPTRNLRSSGKVYLKLNPARTTKSEKSFVYQSITFWNQLSDDLRAVRNFNLFKARTKTELLLSNLNFPE